MINDCLRYGNQWNVIMSVFMFVCSDDFSYVFSLVHVDEFTHVVLYFNEYP